MLDELREFLWMRPRSGQRGVEIAMRKRDDVDGAEEQAIVVCDGGSFVEYFPLQERESLYRVLASVDPTPEGILAFVRDYGFLGAPLSDLQNGAEIDPTVHQEFFHEFIWEWKSLVLQLREYVRVWDLIEGGDTAALSENFRWEGDTSIEYVPPSHISYEKTVRPELWAALDKTTRESLKRNDELNRVIASAAWGYDLEDFDSGDVLLPARLWLYDRMNAHLQNLQTFLEWDPRTQKTRMRSCPLSLAAAVYYQMAVAVLNGRVSKQCQSCGVWFEITPRVSRSDRVTCSSSCRTRLYRERRDKAIRLFAEGKQVKTIAKEIGSDLETVRKWVKKTKKKKG